MYAPTRPTFPRPGTGLPDAPADEVLDHARQMLISRSPHNYLDKIDELCSEFLITVPQAREALHWNHHDLARTADAGT